MVGPETGPIELNGRSLGCRAEVENISIDLAAKRAELQTIRILGRKLGGSPNGLSARSEPYPMDKFN